MNTKLAKIVKEDMKKTAKTQTTSIDDLWTYACGGEIDKLKEYYDNGGKPNRKYHRFDHDHSLIMGALRNAEYETVDFLKQNGETISPEEEYEFKELMEYRNNKKSFKDKKLSKIAKATYTQKQLKEMVANGVAIDITNMPTRELYKLQKEEQLEPIGSSFGTYGANGRLYRGKDGKLYAVTARAMSLDALPW